MASIRSGTYKSHLWLTFDYSYSQNVANNNSSISWSLVLHWDASLNFSASKSYSVTVNGTNYSGSYTGGASGGSGSKTIRSGTTSVGHNADGTKSVSVSASFGIEVTYSGTKISTMTLSGSFTLPTIARATTPTLSVSNVAIGGNVVINTPRASGSFTHTLQINFVNGNWENIATGVTTSFGWTLPNDLLNRIPNTTTSWMQIKCITYNGGTYIGEKTVRLDVSVPSHIVPWVSVPTVSEAISGLANQFGGYIKAKSQLKVAISAGGSYSSSIIQYSTTVSNVGTYNEANFTSGVLWNVGNITITTTVTDSRGRTASASKTVTVLDYNSPSISKFNVVRCTDKGVVDENAGAYARITYAFSIASVGSKNVNSFALQYLNDSGNWTNLTTGSGYSKDTYDVSKVTFDVNKERQFRIVVTDYFGAWYAYATMAPTFTLINFSSDGKGIAIGKVAEDNIFDVGMPARFTNGVTINSLNGYSIGTGNESNVNKIPTIKSDGVMEVGKYIDFHTGGEDYLVRLTATSSNLTSSGNIHAPSFYGQLQGNATTATQAGNLSNQFFRTSGAEWLGLYNSSGTRLGYIGNDSGNYLLIVNELKRSASSGVQLRAGEAGVCLDYTTTSPYNGYFFPRHSTKVTLGTQSYRWYRLYAYVGSIDTSDEREKHNIKPIGIANKSRSFDVKNVYELLFDNLIPKTYCMNVKDCEIENNKIHIGFVAQDVSKTLESFGIKEDEIGIIDHSYWTDEETGEEKDLYGLCYSEFIALNTYMIQKSRKEIHVLQQEIENLKQEIESLKQNS